MTDAGKASEPRPTAGGGDAARAGAAPGSLARLFRRSPTPPAKGFLAGLRIRKKLIVLHTIFSLGLLLFLIVALRPAVLEVVDRAETDEAMTVLAQLSALKQERAAAEGFVATLPDARYRAGRAEELGLDAVVTATAAMTPGRALPIPEAQRALAGGATAILFAPGPDGGVFHLLRVGVPEARQAVTRLYVFTALALLAVYAFIAMAIEVFVLPQHVYGPIRRLLEADRALREGRADQELVPEAEIPRDELGQIMRSRNESVAALRRQESELAEALSRLEEAASDLKRKNHMLETAQRNLADADRLASLGMMSAGIAHELNTPLAVVKGLAERLNANPSRGLDAPTAALMLRVVQRLERLGESLLDFARVRPPHTRKARLRELADEAAVLVRLDRSAAVAVENLVPEELEIPCDADRIVQVLVNVVRNSRDSLTERGTPDSSPPRVEIRAEPFLRDGATWVSLTVADNGHGIDPAIIPRLFEPFASTRLDSRGTGLGLAVAEGIVREHNGMIQARNRPSRPGAVIEILLPTAPAAAEPVH